MDRRALIIYIPVLHKGYIDFIQRNKSSTVYIVGDWISQEIPYLKKEIRKLSEKDIVASLHAIFPNLKFSILLKEDLVHIISLHKEFILPDDDVSLYLLDMYLKKVKHVLFDDVFLRWDKNNLKKDKEIICEKVESSPYIRRAEEIAGKSSDWWRQVGVVIVKNNSIIIEGYNKHVPHEYTNYINGDPRNASQKGKDIELSSAIHAEAIAIATAAQKGILLEGSTMYVTTFPCPVCAKLIAYSGIKNLVFSKGYAMLDAQDILKSFSIKIQQVKENPR